MSMLAGRVSCSLFSSVGYIMGNSVSQPAEMYQYFLAISFPTDYYSESKNYFSHFFIGNKTCSEGNEGKNSYVV